MYPRNVGNPTPSSKDADLIGSPGHSDSCSGDIVHGASGTLIAVTVGLSVGNSEDRQCKIHELYLTWRFCQ